MVEIVANKCSSKPAVKEMSKGSRGREMLASTLGDDVWTRERRMVWRNPHHCYMYPLAHYGSIPALRRVESSGFFARPW